MKNIVELKPPLLTIAIPTFNRVECLRVLLSRVFSELEALPAANGKVEVLVVNNNSTDGSFEFLNTLRMPANVQVIHQPSNVGMDRNFVTCMSQANGEWFWLLSDDDLPMVGSLQIILTNLTDNTCGLIQLPTNFRSGSLEFASDAASPSISVIREGSKRFAGRVNGLFTFISGMLIRREAYLTHCGKSDMDRLVGTYFAHLEWVFEILKREEFFGFFNGALVLSRSENSGGFDFVQVFTERFLSACKLKLNDRSDLRDLIFEGMKFRHLPRIFFNLRQGRNGDFNFKPKVACRTYGNSYGFDAFYLIVMLPIIRFPVPLAIFSLVLSRVWGRLWYSRKLR